MRQPDLGDAPETAIEIGGIADPGVGDEIDLADQPVADHRLQRIEPRIAAHADDAVAVFQTMVTELPHKRREVIVVGDDHAAVRPDVEVLERMKGKASGAAEGAGLPAVDIAEDALAGILDHRQIMLVRDLHESRHVGHLPGEVDRQKRLGAFGDPRLDLADVHAEIVGAVDKDRAGVSLGNGAHGGDEGVGRRDHFVARTDPDGLERQLERVGARVHADGMTAADYRCELLLELAHRLAQREVAGRNELAEQVEDFLDILGAELLGQVRPLDLVSVGLKRQIDARH